MHGESWAISRRVRIRRCTSPPSTPAWARKLRRWIGSSAVSPCTRLPCSGCAPISASRACARSHVCRGSWTGCPNERRALLPAQFLKNLAELLVLKRNHGEVWPLVLPLPPLAAAAAFVGSRELVAVQLRANEFRRAVGERVGLKQAQGIPIAFEQLADEVDEPRVAREIAHRGEPHQPVEPQMVGRDLRRIAPGSAGLAAESVLLPLAGGIGDLVACRSEERRGGEEG